MAKENTPEKQNEESGKNIARQFKGLPMSELISAPLRAACQSQIQLAGAAFEFVTKIGFKDGDLSQPNLLKFELERPVQTPTGVTTNTINVQAPFLGLVPIPSLLIDSVNIDFQMEVSAAEQTKETNSTDASVKAGFKSWFGTSVEIQGNVSSAGKHPVEQPKRQIPGTRFGQPATPYRRLEPADGHSGQLHHPAQSRRELLSPCTLLPFCHEDRQLELPREQRFLLRDPPRHLPSGCIVPAGMRKHPIWHGQRRCSGNAGGDPALSESIRPYGMPGKLLAGRRAQRPVQHGNAHPGCFLDRDVCSDNVLVASPCFGYKTRLLVDRQRPCGSQRCCRCQRPGLYQQSMRTRLQRSLRGRFQLLPG